MKEIQDGYKRKQTLAIYAQIKLPPYLIKNEKHTKMLCFDRFKDEKTHAENDRRTCREKLTTENFE